MAEQSIKIKIAGREYPLKVTSPDHEEVVRKAADDINKMIGAYQDKFPGKPLVEIMSFVALNACTSNISLNKQIKNLKLEEEVLAKELTGYLDNIDKNGR